MIHGPKFLLVKVIRRMALLALMLDFSVVAHDPRAKGLCDAAAVSKEDWKLSMPGLEEEICRRRVVFKEHGLYKTCQQLPR
jgi:hypothetical protein